MFRDLKFLAYFALILGLGTASGSSVTDPNIALNKASPCERLLLLTGMSAFGIYTDLISGLRTEAKAKAKSSREQAKKVIDLAMWNPSVDFRNFDDVVAYANKNPVQEGDWTPSIATFPPNGFSNKEPVTGPIAILENHLKKQVSAPYSEIAVQTLHAFLNREQVVHWIQKINTEALKAMWDDGLRSKEQINNQFVRALYLDKILARHAKAKGFQINNDLPYDLVTYNIFNFNHYLAQARLFIDWTTLNSHETQFPHLSRGHAIAMAYAADHVLNFVELIKYAGRTYDRQGTWGQLFDNGLSPKTPFWSGFWVMQFQNYLNIDS